MKTVVAAAAAVIAAFAVITVGIIGWDTGRSVGAASPAHIQAQAGPASQAGTHVYLTIATPDMLKTGVGPAFLPSRISVPANADVTVTILNFDNATPLTGAATQWANTTGVEGKLKVETIDPANPNGAATATTTVANLDPQLVSHTFTIPELKMNVPIYSNTRTTFTFRTLGAGTYTWRCMDPCGTGDTGWAGAMSQDGYMSGKLTVA